MDPLSRSALARGRGLLRPMGWLALATVVGLSLHAPVAEAQPELTRAFAFGSRLLSCPTYNDPGTSYTIVYQGTAADLEYSAARGWGYDVVDPGATGYARLGPFDDTANSRDAFEDSCPEEIYDSFIGAKEFSAPCANDPAPSDDPCLPPEGIIFRVDLPNGLYRFAAAAGEAQNLHTSRILVEDGGAGPPEDIGPNHVVLVNNHDQAVHGAGVFARVGFDGFIPPPASGPGFVNMDENGLATGGEPSSPTLQVTQGYLRLHQLKGRTIGTDPNGGDMVIFEIWRVSDSFHAVSWGSTWKYRLGTEEASSPDTTAWSTISFDDSGWGEGPAPFGYGDPPYGTDISLLDPPMSNNFTSIFLRHRFELADPSAINQLDAHVDFDDGFVVWINGVEVLAVNVPSDRPIAFDALALTGHESGEWEPYSLPDPSEYLVAGTNVIAVQVFNNSITSSDLKFDMDLFDPVAPDLNPPEVLQIVPAPGTTIRRLTQVQVSFTEDVVGVDASDLIVAGFPASAVAGSGAGPYIFTCEEPPEGPVAVSWAAGHGITDAADPPNAFAGGGWSYTVDPDAPLGQLVISEFLAVNGAGLQDEDGDESDWIEIHNEGTVIVQLGGWSLTDDPENVDLWAFPSVSLGPDQYLVVFASGKDRTPLSGNLHTSFQLGPTGEYLGLYNAESPREVVSEFAPRYPRQRTDYSCGRDTTGELTYFETPTPGAANTGATTFDGFVMNPVCHPPRGLYDAPVSVTISTGTPGAAIRYTLDGSEPTPTRGTVYSGPVSIGPGGGKGGVGLRAIAYGAGLFPSEIVTHTYIFPTAVLSQSNTPAGYPTLWVGAQDGNSDYPADYGMDPDVVNDAGHHDLIVKGLRSLPTLSVVTDIANLFDPNIGIYVNSSREGIDWERPASAELIHPDGRGGFAVNCGLRIQGGTSVNNWKVIKFSMRLLFKNDYGPGRLRYPLFPDTLVEEFDTIVLDAHMNQTWQHPDHGQRVRAQYCRDQYVSDLQNATGGYAPHDVFAHLYLNGIYWGLYDLHERADDAFAASYFGGDESEYDVVKHDPSNIVAGNRSAYDAMLQAVRRDMTSSANYLAVWDHLDVEGLIDYMIVNIFCGNDDWDHHNWYASRRGEAGAWWRFHSWDAEHVLKDVNRSAEILENNRDKPSEVYYRLRANPEFRLLFADHVHRHFFGGGVMYVNPSSTSWDPDAPHNNVPASLWMRRIDEADGFIRREHLGEADVGSGIACEAARWGDTRRPADPYTRNDEWRAELNSLLSNYFPRRSGNVLSYLKTANLYPAVGAPVFNQHGGRIEPGFVLTMSRPAGTTGTIYCTLDGSDPREFGTGAVAPTATAYSSSITLNDFTVVKARILSGGDWSALNEATFTLSDPEGLVRISEIMYNPLVGQEYEFIELVNTGSTTVGLGGAYSLSGIQFLLPPETSLGPGEYLVLVSDPVAFQSRYPGVEMGGIYGGRLSSGGEDIEIWSYEGGIIVEVEYDDDGFWPIGPDGFGYSLTVNDPLGDLDDPANWRASSVIHGTPGADDIAPPPPRVIINEVLARASPPLEDAIEIVNLSPTTVTIGGWYLSDNRTSLSTLAKFRIPFGMSLPPGGFEVFYEYEFNDPASPARFSLSDQGGAVYLSAANASGELTGYIVQAEYGPEDPGVSFGRIATSQKYDFTALSGRSFGADSPSTVEEFRTGLGRINEAPRFGPVVINEIMYHPVFGEEEFVELFNPTTVPIALFDETSGRGWRISGVLNPDESDSYEFGPSDVIPAQGFLLLVGINPVVFRSLNSIPGSVPIASAFGGALDNGGEWIRLSRPGTPAGSEVPYILVDQVRYNDREPWATEPDGSGPSLERIYADAYGNDPVNWGPSDRFGGTPGAMNSVSTAGENRPPQALFLAYPTTGRAPLDVIFDATRSYDLDGQIVSYSWNFDDGGSSSGAIVAHTFDEPDVYLVTLTVEDDDGAIANVTQFIAVETDPGGGQIPGDANQDATVDISDAIRLLQYLFLPGQRLPCSGDDLQSGGNQVLLNLNQDARVDLSDAIFTLMFLFQNGPPPALGTGCVPIAGCPDVCAY